MAMNTSRVTRGWPVTPRVKQIIIANVLIWLVTVITVQWLGSGFFLEYLALTPAQVTGHYQVWQLLTYMWLHSPFDPWHILINLLFLWLFGGTLENNWGSKVFLRFYLYCGIGAGLIVLSAGYLFSPKAPVMGASGAILGLVAAWIFLLPNHIVYLFNVYPVKGKYFALVPIGLTVADFLIRTQGISHAAHLGGIAVGSLLVTGYWRPEKIRKQIRFWWLRRKLRILEGGKKDKPPDGGYWH